MSDVVVKGWCPGAHRPMMSGDGLIVRVRPFRSELNSSQAAELCRLAQEFGNGLIDLTSRANLQIRGVSEETYPALIKGLESIGVLDKTEKAERHRNILIPHDWQHGDLTQKLHDALIEELPNFPDLPGKVGFALDTGEQLELQNGSADFRIERVQDGLIVRADGSNRGRLVGADVNAALTALKELTRWFFDSDGNDSGRMVRHLNSTPLPDAWQTTVSEIGSDGPKIGATPMGQVIGVPFGRIVASDLLAMLRESGAERLRFLTKRRIVVLGGSRVSDGPFVVKPNSPLMSVHACPGAPACPQATVATLDLARRLAGQINDGLHVSGCSKGCAHNKAAPLTLIGRAGSFDLVRNGATWDTPEARGLKAQDIISLIETT